MLNQKEAATFLNISVYTLDDWVKKGIIIPCKTAGRHRRYPKEDLMRLLEDHKNNFIKEMTKKHDLNESWFNNTNFFGFKHQVIITCPVHGEIKNFPNYFLQKKFPCKECHTIKKIQRKKQKIEKRTLEKEKKYIGMIFGMKKIINYIGGEKFLWQTECTNCKFVCNLTIDYIKKNINAKCYNCRNTKKGELGAIFCYKDYKKCANQRKLTFELNFDEFVEITSKNCFYCNCEPKYDRKMQQEYTKYLHNGIDRIDNTKGYTRENCVSCCKICNSLKLDRSVNEFKIHIKRLIEFRKKNGR